MPQTDIKSRCCGVDVYVDKHDGGTRCTICDSEVDAATGRRLTEREQDARWFAYEQALNEGER